jgi:hypothetical protein
MRKGKIENVPSGFREGLNGRMEEVEKVGNLMTWLSGLPWVQAPKWAIWSDPVKPGQTKSRRKQGFDRQTAVACQASARSPKFALTSVL